MSSWYSRQLEKLADFHEQQATDIQREAHRAVPASPADHAADKKAAEQHRRKAAGLRAEANKR